jgi:hypothetical protein
MRPAESDDAMVRRLIRLRAGRLVLVAALTAFGAARAHVQPEPLPLGRPFRISAHYLREVARPPDFLQGSR